MDHRRGGQRRSPVSVSIDVAKGGLMGIAEAIPGVSGGTIALIVGIYEAVITSAGHLVSAIRHGLTALVAPGRRDAERAAAAEQFRLVRWGVVIPVLIGMAVGLVLGARLLEPIVAEEHGEIAVLRPEAAALFFGMMLVAVLVPFSMVGRWRPVHIVVALAAAAVAFVVTGLPTAEVDPSPMVVAPAAAIAVCALVLPGVSGSFLLLTLGLYLPTLAAVKDFDLGYLATFGLGAVIGLAAFVKVLQWLLEQHHRITMVVLTGLVAGSLRSLWPWQDVDRTLRMPDEGVGARVGLILLGMAVVGGLVVLDRRARRRAEVADTGQGIGTGVGTGTGA